LDDEAETPGAAAVLVLVAFALAIVLARRR
jgi:uncharacterized protein (TIGR03382 family)